MNFTAHDVTPIANAGFNVDMGYISAAEGQTYRAAVLPHPIHEYDVYVYNSDKRNSIANPQSPGFLNLAQDTRLVSELNDLRRRPIVRIGLTGFCEPQDSMFFGVPIINVVPAHSNVSKVQFHGRNVFSFPELNATLENLTREIVLPVAQYITAPPEPYPIWHVPVIFNKNADVVAAYGRWSDGKLPLYILLPQMKNNASALINVFEALLKLDPNLFPDIKRREWYTSEKYAFSEERTIEADITNKLTEIRGYISQRRAEAASIAARFRFLKEILVATEEPAAKAERLSSHIKATLEFIGFEVEDIDERIKSAIRKEDLWVRRGKHYLAITEVSGTKGTNPKTKEFNDILGRMATIFKRKDLVPDSSDIKGLLILNYDIENPPDKRPLAYHDHEDIVDSAKEHDIGILSTVELYYLALAVKDGALTKDAAQAAIMQPGRVLCPEAAKASKT